MNRRPLKVETSYYGVIPAHAVLQWEVTLTRTDREYNHSRRHREFLWHDDNGAHHCTVQLVDGEVHSFSGCGLHHAGVPSTPETATPEEWAAYCRYRFPEHKLAEYRADGWTVTVWIPADDLTLF